MDVNLQVAAAKATQMRHAEAAQVDDLPCLRAGLDADGLLAVEGFKGQLGAQCRGRHGDAEGGVEIVALAEEGGIVVDLHFHVQVTGGAACRAYLALAAELDAGSRADAGGDLDGEGAAVAHAAITHAFVAGVDDHGTEALARVTGGNRHDIAQDRAHGALDLAAAVANVAGGRRGAGTAATAITRGADDGRVDFQLLVDAEDGLTQFHPHRDEGVLTATRARCRTAATASAATSEEGLEDVLEGKAIAAATVVSATVIVAVFIARGVVDAALLRVREDLVGVRDRLETVLGIRGVIDVRVQLPGQLAVSLLDFLGCRVAGDAQCVVVIAQNVALFTWKRWPLTGQNSRKVLCHGADAGHGVGVVHPGGSDDAEFGVLPRPVACRNDGGFR